MYLYLFQNDSRWSYTYWGDLQQMFLTHQSLFPLPDLWKFGLKGELLYVTFMDRGRGGIGRRAALRSLWGQPCGSSSLLDRTINLSS